MKTQDLRIGNYVNHICNDELVTDVIADVGYHLLSSPKSTTSRKDSDVVKELKPIPLTEEWLLKFGFEKLKGWDDTFFFQLNGVQILEYNGSGYDYNSFNIKHAHQLQNLYFALTGEELTIKQNE